MKKRKAITPVVAMLALAIITVAIAGAAQVFLTGVIEGSQPQGSLGDVITPLGEDGDGNTNPPPTPQCNDGVDNDGDGATDFPADFSCSSQDDDDEGAPLSACQDGVDNDGDNVIDLADFSCGGDAQNDDENLPLAQCQDGLDNDGDGATDYPTDPDCSSLQDDDEGSAPPPECFDGLDNDNDGWVDGTDYGCTVGSAENVPGSTQCSNQVDDDGDGWVDGHDPDCTGWNDDTEGSTPPPPECSDGVDNDGDGWVDGADYGCTVGSTEDVAGSTQCSNQVDDVDAEDVFVDGHDPGCVDWQDDDEVNAPPPECSDGVDNDGDDAVDGADYGCQQGGPNEDSATAACQDGTDNDGDGATDFPADPDCSSLQDDDEGVSPMPECSDGVDNDWDGWIDYPDDLGCDDANDVEVAQFTVDFAGWVPADGYVKGSGVDLTLTISGDLQVINNIIFQTWSIPPQQIQGPDTNNPSPGPYVYEAANLDQISDGSAIVQVIVRELDSVGGYYLHQTDFGPTTFSTPTTECSDGVDNDGDGAQDYPDDYSCSSASDDDESSPLAECQDTVDNDGDGATDLADGGCVSNQDGDETNCGDEVCEGGETTSSCSEDCPGGGGNFDTWIALSQPTENYAPLGVHVNAIGNLNWDEIAEYDFEWDFGDGSEKFYGYMAAHVFDAPGTYNVILTVRDANGDSQAFGPEVVTVTDPDDYFDGSPGVTYCFSNDNDFTGCPAGANQVPNANSWSDILSNAGGSRTDRFQEERRYMLKSDDTFTIDVHGVVGFSGGPLSENIVVTSFGTGQPARSISNGAHLNTFKIFYVHNFKVHDIEFDGGIPVCSGGGEDCRANLFLSIPQSSAGVPRHVLISDATILDAGAGVVTELTAQYSDLLMSNLNIDGVKNYGFGLWGIVENIALIDSTIRNTAQHNEHAFRACAGDKTVVAGNTFDSNERTNLHIRGGVDWLVADNFFSDTTDGGDTLFHIRACPGDPTAGDADRIIIDRNRFINHIIQNTIGDDVVIKNNIIEHSNGISISDVGGSGQAQRAKIYNNVQYSSQQGTYFLNIRNGVTGIDVRNNIYSAPFLGGTGGGNAPSIDENNYDAATVNLQPDFTLLPGSEPDGIDDNPGQDGPVALVSLRDFAKILRPINGIADIGAFEYTG